MIVVATSASCGTRWPGSCSAWRPPWPCCRLLVVGFASCASPMEAGLGVSSADLWSASGGFALPLSGSFLAAVLFSVTTGASATAGPAQPRSLDLAIAAGMLESAAHRSATHDVTGFGGGIELQLGYRLVPQLSIGTYATFEAVYPTLDSSHRNFLSATAGIRAEWHFDPSLTVDTWASIGTGIRWTSLDDDRMSSSTSLAGLELAKFQFGGDFPVSPGLSVGPAVAISASTFVAKTRPPITAMPRSTTRFSTWQTSPVFVFAPTAEELRRDRDGSVLHARRMSIAVDRIRTWRVEPDAGQRSVVVERR